MNKIILLFWIHTALFASMIEVDVISPKQTTQALSIEVNGIVIPEQKSIITSKSKGIIKLFINNNTNILKGDKIAQIIDERREQNLQLLKTKLTLVESELKLEKIKLADIKEMYSMGVGSKNSYLNEQLLYEQLKEKFQTLDSEYKIVELEQKNSTIYAVQSGTITNLIPLNSYISYGTSIATFIAKESVVKLFVDATYANKLQIGNSVIIENSSINIKAKIIHILPISKNNLIEIIAKPEHNLPLHMQVNASINLASIQGLIIPKSAIVLVQHHPAVYTIKNKVAHLHFVTILKDMLQTVLIKNTLDKDAKVVIKNSYMLYDGLKIIVK